MRLLRVGVVVSVLAVAVAAGCTSPRANGGGGGPSGSPGPGASGAPSPSTDPAAAARALVARLGDEDLVGQVLMPYVLGTDARTVSAAAAEGNRSYAGVATPAEMVARYRLGGLILMRRSDDPTGPTNSASNIESPEQVRRLTAGLQGAARGLPAKVPLLIGADQEFGAVTRLREGVTQLPSAMAFGAAADPRLTEAAWRAAGTELAAVGINVDFAPVADVLGAAGSAVIGSRSFGGDARVVSGQVAGAVRGLQGAGVAATLKHFPGHGHTTADSHSTLPVLAQSRQSLEAGDLPPFRAGVDAGAWLVMSGHLDVRAVDPGTPATFSRPVLTDVLRRQLGFGGITVTDALTMEPARRWPAGEAAVRALLAGNDMLLMPPDLAAAHAGLLGALRSGRLPRAHLAAAVTRILTVKLRLAGSAQPDLSVLGAAAHRAAAVAAATAAVTLLRGACGRPLVTGPVRVTAAAGRERQRDWLVAALRAAGAPVTGSGGTLVHLVGYGDGAADLRADAAVTVAMDTPYLLTGSRSATLLATYSSAEASMTGLAAVLLGKARPAGRSPVPLAGLPRTACR